ncbi:hypothetical protein K2X33_12050 [bacterium]|nr:hypothetical protein [bacterium]
MLRAAFLAFIHTAFAWGNMYSSCGGYMGYHGIPIVMHHNQYRVAAKESALVGVEVVFHANAKVQREDGLPLPVVGKVQRIVGDAPCFRYSIRLRDGSETWISLSQISSDADVLHCRTPASADPLATPPEYRMAEGNSRSLVLGETATVHYKQHVSGRLRSFEVTGEITELAEMIGSPQYYNMSVRTGLREDPQGVRRIMVTREEVQRLRKELPFKPRRT